MKTNLNAVPVLAESEVVSCNSAAPYQRQARESTPKPMEPALRLEDARDSRGGVQVISACGVHGVTGEPSTESCYSHETRATSEFPVPLPVIASRPETFRGRQGVRLAHDSRYSGSLT